MTLTTTEAVSKPPWPSEISYEIVSWPLKSASGVYVIVPSLLITTEPLAAEADTTLIISPSKSESLASTSITTEASSSTAATSSPATGPSLIAFTVTVTSAVSVPPWPSEISYEILSCPLKFAFGVYVTVPSLLMTTEPLAALAAFTLKLSPSKSISLAKTSTITESSSSRLMLSL